MTARRLLIAPVLALLALGTHVAPAVAENGGAVPGVVILPGTPPTVLHFGNPVAVASANGITIATRATAMLRGRLHVRGSAPHAFGGVRIERLDPKLGWLPVASAAVTADGSFDAVWRASRIGPIELRVVPGGSGAGGSAANAAPQVGVTVYRAGVASWYAGPGSYGATTACHVTLRRGTLGVAHRSLPCGTPVALYYRGRMLVVPVIDRGPYVTGRTWDLTYATARALGATAGLVTLGALAAPVGG
jgi:rare lipoprotein A